MRDRLIELLHKNSWDYLLCEANIKLLADHLLENGVIVPPVSIGSTVYAISETRAKEAKVDELYINSQKRVVIFADFDCDEDCEGCPFEMWSQSFCGEWDCGNQFGVVEIKIEELGKTVFLTKEEAEQALKEREKV